ncbi:MAG: hypothetical protein ALECFALPRED_002982 [Alectoria fallacina]|uniref:AB hydrolase-1 domain-containing protein n=1 Tax=Alectoria fallacina TaxID=1903189 RepID=A0A8H3EDT0_9LECA|nr:MAG: hypothetical protein ALECFALPRED_002982 [Alectoria fallacina]
MLIPSLLASTLVATSVVAKHCQNLSVPVTIRARNGVFNVATLRDNHDATTFFANFTKPKANFSNEVLLGYQTIDNTYDISVKFCQPDTGYGQTVQLLTHGIGFDKTYWDLSYNAYNYSYIDLAVDEYGFSTLSIDRLGIGNSSIADPLSIIQVPTELSAIYELTMMLRRGGLPNVPWAFSKIVHVGHSLGSILSYNLAAMDPTASDGLILTGFSQDSAYIDATFDAWASQLVRNNEPRRFGDLPTGYLTWANASSNEKTFLYPGFFDPAILQFSESNKEPYTTGEVLTLGSSPFTIPEFKGPVQVLVGNQDFIFCGGDCLATGDPALAGTSIPGEVAKAFPAAKAFEAYIQPNTGHAINLHYNATGAYKATQAFLISHGLGST